MRAIIKPNNPWASPKCWCTTDLLHPHGYLYPRLGRNEVAQSGGGRIMQRLSPQKTLLYVGDTGDTAAHCQSNLLWRLILKKKRRKKKHWRGSVALTGQCLKHRTTGTAHPYVLLLVNINPDFIFPPIFLPWYYAATTAQSHSQSFRVDLSTGGPT